MDKVVKTETVAEFLARGGKVTKCPMRKTMSRISDPDKRAAKPKAQIDMSALPESLKIRFGVK